MTLLQRLKNLWFLSGTHIYSNSYRDIQLKIPQDTTPQEVNRATKKLATIIEVDKVDMFHDNTSK